MKTNKTNPPSPTSDANLIYQESEANALGSPLAKGGCGVCERYGFPLFLVRKAPIPLSFNFAGDSSLVKSLKANHGEPELDLTTHRYVYRTLRTGYLYILLKHKVLGWQFLGYEITPSGVFRHRTIHDMKEREISEIPSQCIFKSNHHIPGMFINIDTTVYQEEAYLAYSRRAWSKDGAIKHYLTLMNEGHVTIDLPSLVEEDEASDKDVSQYLHNTKTVVKEEALKRFTKINLSRECRGNPALITDKGERSLGFRELRKQKLLLEFEANPHHIKYYASVSTELHPYYFLTAHPFHSLRDKVVDANSISYRDTANKMDAHMVDLEMTHQSPVPVIVIDDVFGIAEELSVQQKLNVEPIMQMLVEAETAYTGHIEKAYERVVKGTDRLDEMLSDINKNYYKRHPDEGRLMEKGGDDKKDNVGFLEERFYSQYNSLACRPLNQKSNYFNEKRYHMRKTLSIINEYRNNIVQSEKERLFGETLYTYNGVSTTNVSGHRILTPLYKMPPDYYEKLGYQPILMSKDEEKKHLEEKKENDPLWVDNTYYKVYAYRLVNPKPEWLQEKIDEKLNTYNDLLDAEREATFLAQDKKDYEALIAELSGYLDDYVHYLVWLLGFKGCSEYAPTGITTFYDCDFWRLECDTNASNNHIGYIEDVIKLVDFALFGETKTGHHLAIWDMLIGDENSLFYHVLDGRQGSFWSQVLSHRFKHMQTELSSTSESSLMFDYTNQTEESMRVFIEAREEKEAQARERLIEQTAQILVDMEKTNQTLDALYSNEKGELMLALYSTLITKAAASIANYPVHEKDSQKSKHIKQIMQRLASQSALVITGEMIVPIQIPNVPVNQLNNLMAYFEPLSKKSATLATELTSSASELLPADKEEDSVIDWEFVTVSSSINDFVMSINSIVTDEGVLITGKKLIRNLKTYFRIRRSLSAYGRRFLMFHLGLDKRQFRLSLYNSVTAQYADTLRNAVNNAHLSQTSSLTKKTAAITSSKVFFSALDVISQQISYQENLEKLNDTSLGENEREKIRRDMQFYHVKLTAAYSNTINEVLLFANMSLPNAIRGLVQNNSTINGLANGLLKTSTATNIILMRVVSLIGILDGALLFMKGYNKTGSTHTAYMIAGGLQIMANLVLASQAFGVIGLASTLGAVIFIITLIITVAVSIISYVFRDKSDEWDDMQLWFNRSLFGQWAHQDKGSPYVPTFESMAIAINDYMVARMGVRATLQMESERIYYDKSTRAYLNIRNELLKIHKKETSTYVKSLDIKDSCKEIYLSVGLPQYDTDISDYEMILRLYDSNVNDDVAILKITKHFGKDEHPIIEYVEGSPTDILVKRDLPYEAVTDEDQLIENKVGRVEIYGESRDKKEKQQDAVEQKRYYDMFTISYKVGEYYAAAKKEFYLQLAYWQHGRESRDEDNNLVIHQPIVKYYTGKH